MCDLMLALQWYITPFGYRLSVLQPELALLLDQQRVDAFWSDSQYLTRLAAFIDVDKNSHVIAS